MRISCSFWLFLIHCAALMRYGPAPAPFWPWSWPAFHAPLALAIHYLSMSVGVSPSTVLVTPNLTPFLPALFAFCQNGKEENLHGRCICGIFPPSRRFRCLHVLFNHFCFPSPHFPFPFRLHFLCSLAHSCLRFPWSFPWSPLAGSPFVLHFYAYFRMSWPVPFGPSLVCCVQPFLKCDIFLPMDNNNRFPLVLATLLLLRAVHLLC